MARPADAALAALRDACAEAAAATEADAVDGVPAALVARPTDVAQVAGVMRAAAAHGLTVVARGRGTRLTWGAPPERVSLVLDLSRLDRIVDHAAGDLVLVAEPGARIAEVQRQLARARQRLAVDSPTPGATLGGAVATAHSGPLRHHLGPIKDQLIGIRLVRADGTPATSGGRVVKNVAGYDLARLLCGSYGTLAVTTGLMFRLRPLPPTHAYVVAPVLGPALAAPLVEAVAATQLAPTAIELDLPAAAGGSTPAAAGTRALPERISSPLSGRSPDDGGPSIGAVVVLIEGIPAAVAGRAAAIRDLLHKAGAEEIHVQAEPPRWWGALPAAADAVLLRLTYLRSGLPEVLCAARLHGVALRGSAATGVLTAALPPGLAAGAAAAAVAGIRSVCARHGGTAVVLDAPRPLKAALDLWGPVPALDLMRRVKARFDPARRLAPGRFVGGI